MGGGFIMRKNLQNKILISLLMAGSIGILGFNNITSAAMIYETQLPPHPGNGIPPTILLMEF